MNDSNTATRGNWRRRAAVVSALAGVALTGGVLASTSANAATPSHTAKPLGASARQRVGSPQQVYTSSGFHVYDFTSHPMKLTSVTGDRNFEGRPNVGDIMQPGEYQDFEVSYQFMSTQRDTATYDILGDNGQAIGTFTVNMQVTDINYPSKTECSTTGPFYTSCKLTDTTVNVQDQAGTVVDLPASQSQHQADVLRRFCLTDNQTGAQCDFHAANETVMSGPWHFIVGSNNRTDVETPLGAVNGDKRSEENSVETGFTAQAEWSALFGKVSAEIEAKYGHTWTHTHTYEVSTTFPIPPHMRGEIWGSEPIIRDTGDFTVQFHNTTFKMHDVHFDTPDPDTGGNFESREMPLPPAS